MLRVMLLLVCVIALPARADFPGPALLDELKSRITEPPRCHPTCAAIQSLGLDLGETQWNMVFDVHAQTSVGIPLPSADGQWRPNRVEVDDRRGAALARDAQGTLWVLAPQGRHRLTLKGPAPARSQVDLPLPLRPARVVALGEDNRWIVNGLDPNGVPQGALQLIRRQQEAAGRQEKTLEPGVLPPLLTVSRTLQLGLDWTVLTQVERRSPAGSPLTIDLPLIAGEAVTSPEVEVVDGRARVRISSGATRVSFRSRLAHTDRIRLTASADDRWTEVWRMDVAPLWHVAYTGIPVIHHQDGEGAWLPTFAPYPGESVSMDISRPAGVPGSSLTVDESSHEISPGQSTIDSTLTLVIRASQGGQHVVRLPEAAQLRSVAIDGKTQPVRQQGPEVALPVHPGKQRVTLAWRQDAAIGSVFRSPVVDLGQPSVNHSLSIKLGEDRWTLFTAGPLMGPAVLFWSALLIVVLVAVALGRSGRTPLPTHQWVLLGIGLTQLDPGSAVLVVLWLLAIDARARLDPIAKPATYNMVQIAFVALTVLALTFLFEAVSRGLLGYPAMQIEGNNSHAYLLNWYQDRVGGQPDQGTVVSVPLWVYRVAMLSWALWLAFALLDWLKVAWRALSRDGLWHSVDWSLPKPLGWGKGGTPTQSPGSDTETPRPGS